MSKTAIAVGVAILLVLILLVIGLVIWLVARKDNENATDTIPDTDTPDTNIPDDSALDTEDVDPYPLEPYNWVSALARQCHPACQQYNDNGSNCYYDNGKDGGVPLCREWFVGDEEQPSQRVKNGDTVTIYKPDRERFVALVDCGHSYEKCRNTCKTDGQYLRINKDPQSEDSQSTSAWRFKVHVERVKNDTSDPYLRWGDKVYMYVQNSSGKKHFFATPSECFDWLVDGASRDHAAAKYSKESDVDKNNEWFLLPWCNTCAVQRDKQYVLYGDDISITSVSKKNLKTSLFASKSNPNTDEMVFAWDPNDYDGEDRRHRDRMRFRFYTTQSKENRPMLP